MTFMIIFTMVCVGAPSPADSPVVTIDRDNVEIAQSCRVRVAASPIFDADNNGVIHITASDITVEFDQNAPALHGATSDQPPDTFTGKGMVITGRNVTLSGAKASGYKVGIHAIKAGGLTIHDVDVSNNFQQRLKSTPQAEDASDWLWPHANDDNQWIANYGAGLCVEDSNNVTLHGIRARRTQNGIILDAVNDSKVYDCDCSFLSGWGLAMWRSNRNVISRNSFDFCVRGYSHGVYNRGQDSAGILMFEQCCENVFAENSATHCGDGLFGFAGKEALGEVNPRPSPSWYKHRGCDDNVFVSNDFSYAAAHGLELTFSFKNRISNNAFRGNAICGIWCGYSQATIIDRNQFANNGEGSYGLERGGVNIEHGRYNTIALNRFDGDACGVHLWDDEDAALLQLPWSRANEPYSSNNTIAANEFHHVPLGIQLRETRLSSIAENNFTMNNGGKSVDADDLSSPGISDRPFNIAAAPPVQTTVHGSRRAVGERSRLGGRHNIVMTEWGPWDHESPLLRLTRRIDGADEYALLGVAALPDIREIMTEGAVFAEYAGDLIRVRPDEDEAVLPYRIWLAVDGHRLEARGVLASAVWELRVFPSGVDPRENTDQWRHDGETSPDAQTVSLPELNLPFGSGGMSELHQLPSALPRDHFGVIAQTGMMFPPGRWRITTTSDDGIRVWMNRQLVIDDWTHHAPRKHTHDFEVGQDGQPIDFRVEYFELDGHAILRFDITN